MGLGYWIEEGLWCAIFKRFEQRLWLGGREWAWEIIYRLSQSSLFQTRYVQNPHSYQALAGGRDGPGLSKIGRGTFIDTDAIS
ncbi:hypothetical protein ASPWEDRAFT_44943 [Aspergillus wentii DTO 134E9]|uniref:Uncharacterized protein n=1 Tax=Aspergillus wentii DTO 134E9 TaxID=1073089 RepID=A0A1L9R7Z0_ASPWE|nr:uncharacterized protein ASPWEDRAFT_44943 [Aspergillus wentii DTO 134E9]OJJ30997.1 hypothetical protein ASPWEDRAFT_44943 [Aspergillus wentii DTO 134E9]